MTQVPASSHGGSTFNGGTITTPLDIVNTSAAAGLVVEPTNATTDDLAVIKIPATYVADSSFGNLLRASFDKTTPNTYVFRVGLGVIDFIAAAGEGAAQLNLSAADFPGDGAALSSESLVVHGVTSASLTARLNDGTKVFIASPDVGIIFRRTSAPADSAIAPGDCALWFDQTNGASKLMVKAKSADTTVVTAAIALA